MVYYNQRGKEDRSLKDVKNAHLQNTMNTDHKLKRKSQITHWTSILKGLFNEKSQFDMFICFELIGSHYRKPDYFVNTFVVILT